MSNIVGVFIQRWHRPKEFSCTQSLHTLSPGANGFTFLTTSHLMLKSMVFFKFQNVSLSVVEVLLCSNLKDHHHHPGSFSLPRLVVMARHFFRSRANSVRPARSFPPSASFAFNFALKNHPLQAVRSPYMAIKFRLSCSNHRD